VSLRAVRLEGVGLHTGDRCAVTLRAEPGPIRFARGAKAWTLAELGVASASMGVTLRDAGDDFELGLVEHCLAALGGLGIYNGVVLDVTGPELPLLGGGSAEYCAALTSLGLAPRGPRLVVACAGTVVVGESRYDVEPGDGIAMQVNIEFQDAAIGQQTAHWNGTPVDFVQNIAKARTFGFERDALALRELGLARGAHASSVVIVLEDGSVHPDSEPVGESEFARHKLLDLVGDAYLCGGPFQGRLRATRPGHARSHHAFTEAKHRGLLVPSSA
jgi:UDP-3-O-[3-hydroxymyristoyl] N-acetylglucosamine deacetylase